MNARAGDIHDPVETDVGLILDYLFDCLSPEQDKLVEARLIEDEAFFRMFVPLARRLYANPTRNLTLLRVIFMHVTTSTRSSEWRMRSAARKGASAATRGAGPSSAGQLNFAVNHRGSSDRNGATGHIGDPLEPIDPDFALLTDYTTGILSPEQEAIVEERLVEDDAFFKMWVPVAHFYSVLRAKKRDSGFVPPPLPVTWHEPR